MGGDYYSIVSTAEVTSGVLHHAFGQISKESNQKVENTSSVEGLREVDLLSLKKKIKKHDWQIFRFVKDYNKDA